ncbi:MAG: sigma-70 family RNA polymerase sigma factor [Saprospiraceae bacterium]|nr:sigma-70 family RNA polymerase sigma factor [Saprospiraceae bacterium]MCB0625937.1 sigma-70 family RNA polymerase sigma factor [Saprospiraceae bacterium]MCB0679104.1 sigma-70 family RNA polymerase sigma factor [Saprospiraceae bacterium]MCB0680290.1 sigma-70 family RNA polymerase sigma factor [Saprospiraceae bacterium]
MTSATPVHPDQRYIDALLANDHALIREIYEQYSTETLHWVRRNSGTADDARDVFQESLLAITQRARKGGFQLTCPFGAYFFLIVRGKWLNELRRRRKNPVTNELPAGLIEGEERNALELAEDTLLADRRERLFQEKFQQLSERCRQLLKLSWAGDKMEVVAQQMGITYAYARKKKSECIAALIKSIKGSDAFNHLA